MPARALRNWTANHEERGIIPVFGMKDRSEEYRKGSEDYPI